MIKIFKCDSGFYAVLFWDTIRASWVLYWSGSRSIYDAMRAAGACRRFVAGY